MSGGANDGERSFDLAIEHSIGRGQDGVNRSLCCVDATWRRPCVGIELDATATGRSDVLLVPGTMDPSDGPMKVVA
jgi:hypothetical protein